MQQQKKHTGLKLHMCDACDKALDFIHFLLHSKEFTLERNMFSVMNVERTLANRQSWNDTEIKYSRKTIPLTTFQSLLNTGKLILNQQYTNLVKNALSYIHNLVNTRELILKRNPSNMTYVERTLAKKKSWNSIKNQHWRESFSLSSVWTWF